MSGWTWAFLLLALGFAVGSRLSEPGVYAVILWVCLAGLNEFLARLERT